MSEMIAPAVRPAKNLKILAANINGPDTHLSIDSKISFRPFVNYLKGRIHDSSDSRSGIYNYLIEKFEESPALLEPVVDEHVLEENHELLEMLGTTLFPVVSEENKNMFTMGTPYEFSVFNYSSPFKKLLSMKRKNIFCCPKMYRSNT
jgi:hypothetical protein